MRYIRYYLNEEKTLQQVWPAMCTTTEFLPEHGSFECCETGTYSLIFDNTCAKLWSKEVYYKVWICWTSCVFIKRAFEWFLFFSSFLCLPCLNTYLIWTVPKQRQTVLSWSDLYKKIQKIFIFKKYKSELLYFFIQEIWNYILYLINKQHKLLKTICIKFILKCAPLISAIFLWLFHCNQCLSINRL